MNSNLLLIILLLILSGLFSGSEVALTSLSRAKVRSMKNDGKFGSEQIVKLKGEAQHALVSILLGNQIVNVLATVTVTLWGVKLFGEGGIGTVTFIFTLILILFSTIGPKTIALHFPEQFARFVVFPLHGFIYVARPFVWVFEILTKGILKLFGVDNKTQPTTSEKEIEAMLDIGREDGVIEDEEESIIKQVLKFSDTNVGDVMTLPKDFESIEAETDKKEIEEFLDEHEHEQYLVYKDNFDDVRGVIGAHELHRIIKKDRKNKPLLNYKRRPLVMVPRSTSLTELFKEFKEKKQRMAVVLDEHGQTVGLVTLGDIMNEITKGEIDETPSCTVMKKDGDSAWEVCGETLVSEIEKELEIKLGYPEHVTIGFIILEELKRFPEDGEKVDLGLVKVEVLKVSKKTIDKVLVRKAHLTKRQKKELIKRAKDK